MTAVMKRDGASVLEELGGLPGGAELLALAAERGDVELVGGATRDLLLGRTPRELDIIIDGEPGAVALALFERLGRPDGGVVGESPGARVHERFSTASLSFPGGHIDIAARRAESYPTPGALPEVRAGTPEEDLRRRDFTVNAIALPLAGPHRGVLRTVPGALEDLNAGRLRVLHPRSFIDDPTRLLRLARYMGRLGFHVEEETAGLAARALADGALTTLSGARLGAELRLALAEDDPLASLQALDAIGVLAALSPPLSFDGPLARACLEAAPPEASREALLLASMIAEPNRGKYRGPLADETRELLGRLHFTAFTRERSLGAALAAPSLLSRLDGAERPSQLAEALAGASLEAIVLAGALAETRGSRLAAERARRWLTALRHIELSIGGEDLLRAGVPAGPEVGRRLHLALALLLDGELSQRPADQLRAALEASIP
jgi:tRNA nucleotidyltransferase (CCA-adding enzyme)